MTRYRMCGSLVLSIVWISSAFASPVFGPVRALNSTAATDDFDPDLVPALATDGAGTWVAVWQSSEVSTPPFLHGNDSEIMFARSTDNGATWSAAMPLNSDFAIDTDYDAGPSIATDRNGNWVVVWYASTPPGDDEMLTSRSSDNGASWSPQAYIDPLAPNLELTYDVYPALQTDGSGVWLATWHNTIGISGEADVKFSRSLDNGANWSPPASLHPFFLTDSFHDYGAIAAGDGSGNWVLVWQTFNPIGGVPLSLNLGVSRSSDGGATWSAPALVNGNAATDTGYDYNPSLRTDGNGNWVTVWLEEQGFNGTYGTDSDLFVARSTDNGATWSAPSPLNLDALTDTRLDSTPSLVYAGDDLWVAVWQVLDNGLFDFVVTRSTDAGVTWSAPSSFSSTTVVDAGIDAFQQLGTDGKGTWVMTWMSDDTLGGTSDGDYDIVYARGVGCPNAPTSGCRAGAPGKGVLKVKDHANNAKDYLVWTWVRGAATTKPEFGDPIAGDSLALCVYDSRNGPSRLLLDFDLLGSDQCGPKPCWKENSKGYKYV